jgi:hypothetical protein
VSGIQLGITLLKLAELLRILQYTPTIFYTRYMPEYKFTFLFVHVAPLNVFRMEYYCAWMGVFLTELLDM